MQSLGICPALRWHLSPVKANVSLSIPSWQILTAHAKPFRGARELAFCLKVPLDSLLVWASSGGSGETARMRRFAWTFAARISDKYQIGLTRSISWSKSCQSQQVKVKLLWRVRELNQKPCSSIALQGQCPAQSMALRPCYVPTIKWLVHYPERTDNTSCCILACFNVSDLKHMHATKFCFKKQHKKYVFLYNKSQSQYFIENHKTVNKMSHLMTKPTMWLCTQRRLRSDWGYLRSA